MSLWPHFFRQSCKNRPTPRGLGVGDAAAVKLRRYAQASLIKCGLLLHTIRYGMIRDGILTCARKPTWVSLIYRYRHRLRTRILSVLIIRSIHQFFETLGHEFSVYCYRCSMVCLRVCVSVCCTRPWVVPKRINGSRCRFCCRLAEAKECCRGSAGAGGRVSSKARH